MKKIIVLWCIEILLGICSGVILFTEYRRINILTLYILLLMPSLLSAVIYGIMLRSQWLKRLGQKKGVIISAVFAGIATVVFGVLSFLMHGRKDVFIIIIKNTKKVLNSNYLIIKEQSNLLDFVMIFVFIFIIFFFIGRQKESKR